MFIAFSSQVEPRARPTVVPAMSAQRKTAVVGAVVQRRNEEVVEEMARIAIGDRARMFAQAEEAAEAADNEKARMTAQAPPTPLYPGRYRDGQHRRRLRPPINPVPPPSPEEARVAAVRWRQFREEEALLLEDARRWADRPRTPTPPRRKDDPYDLAKWASRRGF